MSCTESLGLESSEEMISSLDEGTSSCCCCCCSSSSSGSNRRKESLRMSEKRFPPPLTSLSENGRRNFTLKSVRKDGRLEIVGVMIERPEILCASRKNGRLRLHLVQTVVRNDDDDDENEGFEEEKVEEKATKDEDEVETEVGEEGEEERDQWRVVTAAAASRRCFHMRELQVWGQQHRYVTTR